MAVTTSQSNQFIGHVKCSDHRYTVKAHDLAAVADFAHARIQQFSGVQQIGTLVGRAGDLVVLLKDAYADTGGIFAHACSIDFRRPIIASTRARTCSFFCSSLARSEVSASWRCRSARFSSLI